MKKKFVVLVLALSLLLCSFLSVLADGEKVSVGVLSFLNLSEEDYLNCTQLAINAVKLLEEEGYAEVFKWELQNPDLHIVFYDDLNTMLLGLNTGDIQMLEVPFSTARYLCAQNDSLQMSFIYKDIPAESFLHALSRRISNGFAFLMMGENEALRDDFNTAIAAMKEDGTMDALIKEHITDVISGGEIKPVLLEKKDGRETITMAVTGSLPPMDYVAADGSFAGFNTAVLAEIGKRLDKNIELVIVDSIGRAAALASGTVDVVFWTRIRPEDYSATLNEEEQEAYIAEIIKNSTAEQNAVMEAISEAIAHGNQMYVDRDIPEGAIVTETYFTDLSMIVSLK